MPAGVSDGCDVHGRKGVGVHSRMVRNVALYRSGRKAIGRVLHYANQTYYSRIWRDSVLNTFR